MPHLPWLHRGLTGLLSLGAIALRNGTITTVANASRDWAAKLIGQPDILGVDHIDPQGILLKNSRPNCPRPAV